MHHVISKKMQSDFAAMHWCVKSWQSQVGSLAVPQLNQAPWFLDITRFLFDATAAWLFFLVQGSRTYIVINPLQCNMQLTMHVQWYALFFVVWQVVQHPSKTIELQMQKRGFHAEAGQVRLGISLCCVGYYFEHMHPKLNVACGMHANCWIGWMFFRDFSGIMLVYLLH